LARSKRKGYKKLLQGREKVPTQSEYEKVVTNITAKVMEIADLNEETFEGIILCVNHTFRHRKVAFSLVKNCKMLEYPEGNCKLA